MARIEMPKNNPAGSHTIELCKSSQRHLNPGKMVTQIDKITSTILGGKRGNRGWEFDVATNIHNLNPKVQKGEYLYVVKINVKTKKQLAESTERQDWNNIIANVDQKAATLQWRTMLLDGRLADPTQHKGLTNTVTTYTPVELPSESKWKQGFSHIYRRDYQLDIIKSVIQAGIDTDFQNRFHCALIGDPASGKTETIRSLKALLGEDCVLEYDATATTQAGAIKDIKEGATLPRILIVEEIEKTDEAALRWLLSVMDHRAEIRKVTYRENTQKETKMLTFATVNDYELFTKLMYGALASRFVHHILFPKPDRALLQMILEREVAKAKGNTRWIKPTLDFAEKEDIYDPRKVTGICLCGKDDLLSGKYQKKLEATSVKDYIRQRMKLKKKEKEENAA